MRDALGIDLHPDVLPFSNMPAWLPPFLLDIGRAMTMAGMSGADLVIDPGEERLV